MSVLWPIEKTLVLEKLCSGMSYGDAESLVLMNQQYVLNFDASSRNAHKSFYLSLLIG